MWTHEIEFLTEAVVVPENAIMKCAKDCCPHDYQSGEKAGLAQGVTQACRNDLHEIGQEDK